MKDITEIPITSSYSKDEMLFLNLIAEIMIQIIFEEDESDELPSALSGNAM